MPKFFRIITPTKLDIREITTLGLTTKADGTKIGCKGTGLKFILAFIHRLGGYLEARGPDYHVISELETVQIRERPHQLIRLRSRQCNNRWETNITTHAGLDTWNEPWFILRELVQNTIDEGGNFLVTEDSIMPEVTGTCVQIPLTDELLEAYNTMDQWFQPRYEGFISHGHPEVKGLYYHGFLVYKATEPWAYSYDVTNILKRNELSEDRQIRNVDLSSIFNRLVQHLSFDYDNGNLYNKAWSLSQAQDIERLFDAVYYEINHNHLEWGGPNGFKLSKLLASFYNHFGSKAAFSSSPITESDPNVYYAKAAGYTPVTITYRLHCILNGFSPAKSLAACLPSAAERLKKVKTVDMVRSEKLKSAMRIIKRVRMPDIKVEIVTKLYADDDMKFKALADLRNNRILLLETLLDEDIPTIAKVLIEEFAHIKSGGGDMSLTLQRELIDTIYDLLLGSRRVNVQNIQS